MQACESQYNNIFRFSISIFLPGDRENKLENFGSKSSDFYN